MFKIDLRKNIKTKQLMKKSRIDVEGEPVLIKKNENTEINGHHDDVQVFLLFLPLPFPPKRSKANLDDILKYTGLNLKIEVWEKIYHLNKSSIIWLPNADQCYCRRL